MSSMLSNMSSGIGSFEQVVWDLKARGPANIDIPVLILGIESEQLNIERINAQNMEQLTMPIFDTLGEQLPEPLIDTERYISKGLPDGTLELVGETGTIIE